MTAIYTNIAIRLVRKFTAGKIMGSKLGNLVLTGVNVWALVEVCKMLGA